MWLGSGTTRLPRSSSQVKSPVTASQYRDSGKELEVFQMCQTMSYHDEHFKKNLPPHQYDMVMEQFLTGRLDAKFLPAVLAKRKDFRPAEFSFQISRRSCESCASNCVSSRRRTHLAKLKAHEDAALGDFNQQVMRQQDVLDETWKEQKTLNLQIHVSDSCSAGALLVSQARTIASKHFNGSLQSSRKVQKQTKSSARPRGPAGSRAPRAPRARGVRGE